MRPQQRYQFKDRKYIPSSTRTRTATQLVLPNLFIRQPLLGSGTSASTSTRTSIRTNRMFLSLVAILAISSHIQFTGTNAFSSIAIASSACLPNRRFKSRIICSSSTSNTDTSLDSTTTPTTQNEHPAQLQTIRVRAAVYQPPLRILSSKNSEKDPTTTTEEENNNPLAILTEITGVLGMASRCGIDLVQFPEFFLNGGGRQQERTRERLFRGKSAAALLPPLDRDSSTLNVIGNICAELKVACIIGYAEKEHESERELPPPEPKEAEAKEAIGTDTAAGKKDDGDNDNDNDKDNNNATICYNSLALFHADGSRAGNYRCVHPLPQHAPNHNNGVDSTTIFLKKGHPLIEVIPITLRLPDRSPKASAAPPREVKVGVMCGNDVMVPEQARHLTRSGAQVLGVSGSAVRDDDCSGSILGDRVAKHVLPTRSMENGIPLLFSNYCGNGDEDANDNDSDDDDDNDNDNGKNESKYSDNEEESLGGRSAILSHCGVELVRAPSRLYGDMPSADGYFLPCGEGTGGGTEGAALYAADVDIPIAGSNQIIDASSIEEWDLTPRVVGAELDSSTTTRMITKDDSNHKETAPKGFGREVVDMLEQQQQKGKKKKRQRSSKRK